MTANRTTPNGIASYTVNGYPRGPFPARITPRRVVVNKITFDRVTYDRKLYKGEGRFKLLSYTITPKDIPE